MAKAIRIHKIGGPQAMKWEEVQAGRPKKGEVHLKQTAVGLNYIDTYHRTGMYPIKTPFTLGMEGAGVVAKCGVGVSGLKVGDRVAYAGAPIGSYAEERLMPADRVVKIPRGVSDIQAAAMLLQGMTARYLLRETYRVKAGDTILIHAAAGGVGLIMCQWASHLGATVIGTVGTRAKARLAKAHGCDYPIVYTEQDFVERVRRITKGEMLPVVYDSVGKDTFPASLDCLAPLGLFASFGSASGPVPPVPVGLLTQKGSLFMTRPTMNDHVIKREGLLKSARDLFSVVRKGAVKIEVNQTYALKDAKKAHRDLESRRTTGSTVLLP